MVPCFILFANTTTPFYTFRSSRHIVACSYSTCMLACLATHQYSVLFFFENTQSNIIDYSSSVETLAPCVLSSFAQTQHPLLPLVCSLVQKLITLSVVLLETCNAGTMLFFFFRLDNNIMQVLFFFRLDTMMSPILTPAL